MDFKKLISTAISGAILFSSSVPNLMTYQNVSAATFKSRVSVHDPSVFKNSNGTYYVFGSHIDAAKSNDLQNWTKFTNGYAPTNNVIFDNLSQNLSKAFAWAGENLEDCEGGFAVWAPDVIYNPDYINADGSKGAYMMYFCTTSTYMRSVLAFGVSQNPEGPYTFVDTLIYSGFTSNDSYATSSTKNVNRKYTSTNIDELIKEGKVEYNQQWFSDNNFNNNLFPNAIDPTIYYDQNGKMYMCYGSWSGGIFTIEIDPKTGRCIHPKSGTTSDGRMIDSYFGTKISGGYFKSGEGPFMEYNPETGYFYLWVTYGGLTATGGYNMRVFRSKNPDGPFVDAAGNQAVLSPNTNLDSVGLKVMGNYKFSSLQTAYMACGHNSVLRDDDGKWYLLNHARFNNGTEFHEVRVHSMYFNSEGWPVVAPYEYSGDVMAEFGYNESDIVGEYEFINHGTDTSATIHEYSKILLNADGTISGAASGTWNQAEDSSVAVISVDGVTYNGYFLAAQDETDQNKKVMSFTAVGNNNQTIWGAQTKEFNGTERDGNIDYTNPNSSLVYNPDSVSAPNEIKNIDGTSLLSGVSYKITNKYSQKVIDLTNGNSENGTNIQQWSNLGGSSQEWRIVGLENGYCKIVSMADESKCLTVEQNSSDNGINICLSTYNEEDTQQWKLIQDGTYYGIVSKCSGDKAGLDVYDWSTEDGGNINQWEYWGGDCQLWSVTPVYPSVNEGLYTLKNVNSNKWISTENDGNVIQSDNMQVWNIVKNSDDTYSVIDSDNKALTIENGDGTDGNNIYVSENIGDKSQKFTIKANKDGSYSLLTIASNTESCLDVFEISTESGANICQWEYWGGDGQKFVIQPTVEDSEPIVTTTTITTTTTTTTTTTVSDIESSETTTDSISPILLGDANCDGKVAVADAVAVSAYVSNATKNTLSEQGIVNADVHSVGNGLNASDALMIQQIATGVVQN